MNIRATIVETFQTVARDQKRHLEPLVDDLSLLDSGIDSLCLAVIVARLDDELGVDPFSTAEEVAMPETFGQFVSLYSHAVL